MNMSVDSSAPVLTPITFMTVPTDQGGWNACLLCSKGSDCYEFTVTSSCPVRSVQEVWRQFNASKGSDERLSFYGREVGNDGT